MLFFLGGKYRLIRIVCLDKVSHFCTMIVNYGTKQETINLYHQCGLSKQYSVCKQKGNRLANHRGIYIGKCLKKKNMMKPSIFRYEGHNYLVPFLIISSLFFMWGFAHGILEVLNPHFQESFHISKAMSALTQAAVYGAYFLMALPASGATGGV